MSLRALSALFCTWIVAYTRETSTRLKFKPDNGGGKEERRRTNEQEESLPGAGLVVELPEDEGVPLPPDVTLSTDPRMSRVEVIR